MHRLAGVTAWLLAATLACSSCARRHDTSAASATRDPLGPYRSALLPPAGPTPAADAVNVTYFGSSMLLFDDGQTQVLLDPFVTRPASADARPDPARIDQALRQVHADRLKAIFVARINHPARDAFYIARKTGAALFGPATLLALARRDGVPEAQLVAYAPGATARVGKFRIEAFASRPASAPRAASARSGRQTGGSSTDLLLRSGSHSILVKPSASFIPGALQQVHADVLFLATDALAGQDPYFQDLYYRQTVGELHPALVIPVQWDDPTRPLARQLVPAADTPAAFDFLIGRLRADRVRFGLLQGYHATELFPADR